MQIIDISLPLDSSTPIYPGNAPYTLTPVRPLEGHSSALSVVSLGTHTGTHVDAPSHVLSHGGALETLPLSCFVGPCRVLDFVASTEPIISLEFLRQQGIQPGERILFKTKNSERGFTQMYDQYVSVGSEAAMYLAEVGVVLVGIDAPSIKARGSSDNRPHTVLLERGIPIVEGIDLSAVDPGEYELCCLPLRLIGAEGAPARAVLIVR